MNFLRGTLGWIRPYSSAPGRAPRANSTDILRSLINESPSAKNHSDHRLVISPPPRTGVYAGRSVAVQAPTQLPLSVRQLGQINKVNKVREVKNLQRYHERPGKARLRIEMTRKRREFRAGMKVLFHLALQAQKRGL